MANDIQLYISLKETDYHVGTMYSTYNKGKESLSFSYCDTWLQSGFPLAPSLPLSKSPFYPAANHSLLPFLTDIAPDRWGRKIIKRYKTQVKNDIDYLLSVSDILRQGSLRLKVDNEFVNPNSKHTIPSSHLLEKLLHAADNIDSEQNEDLKILFEQGASLGGARPKANIITLQKDVYIVKFSRLNDTTSVVKWEFLALSLAKKCNLNVPEFKLHSVLDRDILLVKRFDRDKTERIPYLSAMTLLDAHDNDNQFYSYLEIADNIKSFCSNSQADLQELWKRIVFSMLISNTDDHLRNHGFIYNGNRYKLSPLFDVNPVVGSTHLSLLVDMYSSELNLELALSVAEDFSLNYENALEIISNMSKTIQNQWKNIANELNIPKNEIKDMEESFRLCKTKNSSDINFMPIL